MIERLLERREREGLTYAELGAVSGIAARTLSWWAWRLRREAAGMRKEQASSPAFLELVPRAQLEHGHEEDGDDRIDIVLRHGRLVLVRATVDIEALGRIVKELERC